MFKFEQVASLVLVTPNTRSYLVSTLEVEDSSLVDSQDSNTDASVVDTAKALDSPWYYYSMATTKVEVATSAEEVAAIVILSATAAEEVTTIVLLSAIAVKGAAATVLLSAIAVTEEGLKYSQASQWLESMALRELAAI